MAMKNQMNANIINCYKKEYTIVKNYVNSPALVEKASISIKAEKNICIDKNCVDKMKYEEALQTTNVDMPFTCTKCDTCFSDKTSLIKHKTIHLENKPFKCSECSKEFKIIKLLKRHRSNMHIKKRYLCKDCPLTFSSEERLTKHTLIHTGYTCTDCGYHANNRPAFKNHIINVHKPEDKQYACTECDFKSSEAYRLRYHMRKHNGEKPFICDICGKQFVKLYNLQQHTLIHENKKPFGCSTCKKTFRSKFHLQIHMHSHTKEKTYFCAECNFGTVTQGGLKFHMQTVHSNERPFECLACGNKYKTKGNLTKHQNGTRGICRPTGPLKDTHYNEFTEANGNLVEVASNYEILNPMVGPDNTKYL